MTFLDKLADGVLRGNVWSRKPSTLRGCIAAAALVASAEPTVSLARRNTIDQILDGLRAQEAFDLRQAVEAFQKSLDRLRSDGATAREAAIASLAKLADNPSAVDLLMRVAQAVALADGEPAAEVRAVVAAIAAALRAPTPAMTPAQPRRDDGPRRVIVIGNEKGGTGKSTTAIHIAMGLAGRGEKVACIDLDGRQATLSRFLTNRARATAGREAPLVVPRHHRLDADEGPRREPSEAEAQARFWDALSDLAEHDVVVVDTPGHASRLAQAAHAAADVLVTPINDSFIDIDALADIDLKRREVKGPSLYSRLVWQERDRRRLAGRSEADWIVARNRIGQLDSRNTREMASLLGVLSQRLGFRLQPGFSERVVFRELFFRGLTLFDLSADQVPHGSQSSLARARREVADLVDAVSTAAARSTRAQTD